MEMTRKASIEERLEHVERRQREIMEAINEIENEAALRTQNGTWCWHCGDVDESGNWHRGKWL